jgi:DMSO/TMAO reductase YedYZ molybdopterin-dependent catalytic subunit
MPIGAIDLAALLAGIGTVVLLATGMYGKTMPNQNGAPVRLVVRWKCGFKGGKSIVRIRFVEPPPLNTWQQLIPNEYGFYANVNPEVDHARDTARRSTGPATRLLREMIVCSERRKHATMQWRRPANRPLERCRVLRNR